MKKNHWEKLAEFLTITPEEQKRGTGLYNRYSRRGYLPGSCSDMLDLSTGEIAWFYILLAGGRKINSPVAGYNWSNWMVDYDFCFINPKATGKGIETGNFMTSARLLPLIRANAIHLSPFTQYDFQNTYCVRSLESLAPSVIDYSLEKRGFTGEMQLAAFVEAAHLLGKTVGFDLEPHTAQYSIPVLKYPELFRWIKLDESRENLADNISMVNMLRKEKQEEIVNEIKEIIAGLLEEYDISDIEQYDSESRESKLKKEELFSSLVVMLIRKGYWTIPSHTWNGIGIPIFKGYNGQGNYAMFNYPDNCGEDQSGHAFHILTPIKFYDNIGTSERITEDGRGTDFFCDIFSKWRDKFGFDFVRYDSVDHIFDSVDEAGNPLTDRPAPEILQRCIQKSKEGKPYIGSFAERMGSELEVYANTGFDLMLGSDMFDKIDKAHLEKSFEINEKLLKYNKKNEHKFSIVYAIDTHDTGNPHIWGKPLIEMLNPEQLKLRHFMSRFISAGEARRPKYEVIGFQDRSFGLYQSNVRDENLKWKNDRRFNDFYNILEDIYSGVSEIIFNGEIIYWRIADEGAWWVIKFRNEYLIAAIRYEHIEKEVVFKINTKNFLPDGSRKKIGRFDFETAEIIPVELTDEYYMPDLKNNIFSLAKMSELY